jgi:hypothetical protein
MALALHRSLKLPRALVVAMFVPATAVVPRTAHAQAAVVHGDSIDGTWRGTSLCTPAGRPTCHDERVVYHFRTLPPTPAAEEVPPSSRQSRLEWVANKIVNEREEEMGILICVADAPARTISCPMRDWMWTLHMRGDAIDGTLSNAAGVIWRNIEVTRVAPHHVRQRRANP